ncbi:hypothetical protein Ddc_19564 [Ditylenchus destructor]|nr:hypothetical protein Ddc_19564 [Ditylenchus destructor]
MAYVQHKHSKEEEHAKEPFEDVLAFPTRMYGPAKETFQLSVQSAVTVLVQKEHRRQSNGSKEKCKEPPVERKLGKSSEPSAGKSIEKNEKEPFVQKELAVEKSEESLLRKVRRLDPLGKTRKETEEERIAAKISRPNEHAAKDPTLLPIKKDVNSCWPECR